MNEFKKINLELEELFKEVNLNKKKKFIEFLCEHWGTLICGELVRSKKCNCWKSMNESGEQK